MRIPSILFWSATSSLSVGRIFFIFFASFLHLNTEYLFGNSLVLVSLLFISLGYDFAATWKAMGIIILVSGLGTLAIWRLWRGWLWCQRLYLRVTCIFIVCRFLSEQFFFRCRNGRRPHIRGCVVDIFDYWTWSLLEWTFLQFCRRYNRRENVKNFTTGKNNRLAEKWVSPMVL